ncbi:hypothetical protein Tco_0021175, partial [Tanacetum coccineum]
EDHTFEVEPHGNVDHVAGSQEVQTQDSARDREQHLAWELFSYRKDNNGAAFAVAAVDNIYAHELRFGLPRVCWIKQREMYLGHSILPLEGSLSGDCDVEKNGKWSCIYAVGSKEYQMVCTRLNIASADVGMLDKFDSGLQTDVQVFVDFDYAIGRSITGLAIESGFELKIVAGIATGALSKAIPDSRFQHRLN